jgi:spermidine synthase
LGTGAAPAALGRHGIAVDVVEIDPAVVHFAQRYFGFSPTGDVHVEDARAFVRQTERRYDLVLHDTFTGGTTPEHPLSFEVLQRLRAVLRPQGVLALNFVGFHESSRAEASFAVARTLRGVFKNVRAFRDSAPNSAKPVGNTIFFASDDALEFRIPEGTRFQNQTSEQLQRGFVAWPVFATVPQGPLITDARNPLARLQLPVAAAHFEAMNELLPLEVWLN